jgi:hypothetical protein
LEHAASVVVVNATLPFIISRARDFFDFGQKWLLSMESAVVDGKGVPAAPKPQQMLSP